MDTGNSTKDGMGERVNEDDSSGSDMSDIEVSDSSQGSYVAGSLGAAMFTTDELLSLKLLFAIMDQNGDEYIEKVELES